MLSEKLLKFMEPVNETLFQSVPYILVILVVIIILVLLKKVVNYVIFRLHKKDVHRSTNKWWSWEEYENEKKTRV